MEENDAEWFKYSQDTVLSETQHSDDCIQRFGRKAKKGPFLGRKKEKQVLGGRKLTFIKYLITQALFLIPNFSYFREVL